jgi:hypothetical protein
MTRQFLTDQQPAPPAPAAAPASQPAVQQQSAKSAYQDALAGAFPAWDLLPATPFIRRVK